MFDTLSSVRRMKQKGLTQDQAEAIADELREARDINFDHLATKSDLRELQLATSNDLKELQMSTKNDLRELELRTTIRMGTMIIALGGFLTAIKFFG